MHHAFLYISLPSLHGYDVKIFNCKFNGGRKQVTIQEIGINATKIEKKRESILKLTFSLPLPPSMLKLPSFSDGDGDGDGIEIVKTAIGLLSKTTSLHVHHAFLYIS